MKNLLRRLIRKKQHPSRPKPTITIEHHLTSEKLSFPSIPIALLPFEEVLKIHPEIQALQDAPAETENLEIAGGRVFESILQDFQLFSRLMKVKVLGKVTVGLVGDGEIIVDPGQEELLRSTHPGVIVNEYNLESVLRQVAARLYEQRADALAQDGDAHGNRENYVKAAREYIRALEIAPNEPITYMSLGVVVAQAGYFDQGLVYLEKALELNPSSERIRNNLNAITETRNAIRR